MKWIITDPRGVEEALKLSTPTGEIENKERYTEPALRALDFIVTSESLGAIERLDVYAEAYFARILESLQVDFALTFYLIGEAPFQKLIADYLKNFPSRTQNIGEVGKHLPHFIRKNEIIRDFPYLADAAALEWLAIESFYTSPLGGFTTETLACLSEEDWSRVAFKLNDSLRLTSSIWPLHKLWLLRDTKNPAAMTFTISESPTGYVLYQLNGTTHVHPVSGIEYDALELLNQGNPLSSVMDRLSLRYPTNDLSAEIGPLFGKWIAQNFIQEILL
jgi:hypothetical protein